MAKALILPLNSSDAGPSLGAIRQLADPESRSDPHVTVRYPIQRIDSSFLRSSLNTDVRRMEITEAGCFRSNHSARSTIYLGCSSEWLESFNYKPHFPDSVFHITVYEGETSEFSEQLLSLLIERRWHLTVKFPKPTKLEEIPIGKNVRRNRRSQRFTSTTHQLLSKLAPELGKVDLEALSDPQRLDAIELVLDHLHRTLGKRKSPAKPRPVIQLHDAPREWEQQSLLTGPPVPVPGAIGQDHRFSEESAKSGGLVLTPPELAEQMVAMALKVHRNHRIDFGDPAFGSGIFFAVLSRLLGDRRKIHSASGVELDSERSQLAAGRWRSRQLQMYEGNFLTAEPQEQWNFVLANPPYVRSQEIPDQLKESAAEQVWRSLRLRIPARSNLYVYFMLSCHQWLAPSATSAWLIPADFMETSYAAILRKYLTEKVSLLRIHTFNPTEYRFENVRVSPAIVVFKNLPPNDRLEAIASRGGTIDHPIRSVPIDLARFRSSNSWRPFGPAPKKRASDAAVALGNVFKIRRGIATGANQFFVLSGDRVEELELESSCLRPLLPRPRYMPKDRVIEANKNGDPIIEPKLFVIDSAIDIEVLRDIAPNIARYLDAVPDDVRDRLLVRRRSPFYRQEAREPADLVVSAMGRQRQSKQAPVAYYLNQSNAIVLNNYLCFYPVRGHGRMPPELGREVLQALDAIPANEYLMHAREYAGGMFKLEPRDIAEVRIEVSDCVRELMQL